MSLADRVSPFFIHDPFTASNGKLTPTSINCMNALTTEVNSVLKTGRDSLGVGATFQKSIPFIQLPLMSTAARDSVAGLSNGLLIYNTDTNKAQVYAAGVWVDLH